MSGESGAGRAPPPPPLPQTGDAGYVREGVTKSVIGPEWARGLPELAAACARARLFEREPSRWRCGRFESLLQRGPTCGLVALAILLRGAVSVDGTLLPLARRLGFSAEGEMFSAPDMLELCERAKGDAPVRFELRRGGLEVGPLLEGRCALVPYDAYYNHSPCLRDGRSAHWALVVGALVADDGEAFVAAKHGKSLNLNLWRLDDLNASNRNLREVAEVRSVGHVLPEGGLDSERGLNGQYILVHFSDNILDN